MADAYGSGPYGRKSLRVQLPSRPFLFWGFSMRKYGYKRPSATLYTRRRVRTKRPSFFLKFFSLLFLLVLLGGVLFLTGRYAWQVIARAQITDWHVKTVAVSGFSGGAQQTILARITPLIGQPFSMADASELQAQLVQQYPMFEEVDVSRGLLSGKLTVSGTPRHPVARFEMPDHRFKYIDQTSTIYADPQGPTDVLHVQLVGPVPEKLDPSFVELVQSILKLKKSIPFEALQLNLERNTVTMRLPDGSTIAFGAAHALKEKAARAAQIMDKIRGKYPTPVILNFEFFNQGKVFLTQKPH